MKKNHILEFALVAMIASLSACNSNSEAFPSQSYEIKLTSEIIPSRVNDLDYQSTQIVEGQKVGVTITGASGVHNNVAWTAGADGSLTNEGAAIYYKGNSQTIITAYHPYNKTWTGTNHVFTVSKDQSTNEGYLASDLLWVTETVTHDETAVALTFSHKLAKINVTLTSTDITDLSGATISICGTEIAAGFNSATGILSNMQGAKADIKAGVIANNLTTASAIIVPQTVEKGTKFIKFTHGDKSYYYALSDEKEFQSGHAYNYSLRIDSSNMENPLEGEESEW